MIIDERVLARLPAKLAQSLLALASQAAEYGVTIDLGMALAVSRASAGRLGGQRSAAARTQRYGSAQPTAPPRSKPLLLPKQTRSKPRSNPVLLRSKPEANAEANTTCFEANPKQNTEAKPACFEPDAEGPRFPPLGSPSSDHSSYSDLLRISSSSPLLASPKDLTGSARVHAVKPKAVTWRRVPADWEPTPEHASIARDMAVDLALEASKFRDHEFARPKRDAHATFRNWLRAAKPSPRPLNGAGHSAAPRKHATVADIDAMLGLK